MNFALFFVLQSREVNFENLFGELIEEIMSGRKKYRFKLLFHLFVIVTLRKTRRSCLLSLYLARMLVMVIVSLKEI